MPRIVKKSAPVQLLERNTLADQALSHRFDALNEVITESETHLRSIKPIDSIWYSYQTECSEGGSDRRYLIGFCKLNGKWRLVHNVDDGRDDESPIYPLTDLPVERRVRAAASIPKLHELIVESKEDFLRKVDDTIALLKSFTSKAE